MAASFPNLFDYSTDSGMVIPMTDEVKTNIQNAMFEIFGSGFDITDETPNGRLIEALTMLVKNSAGVSAQNMNAMNLNYVSGKQLDNFASFFGVSRLPASKSRILVTVFSTTANYLFAEGSIVKDSLGRSYKVCGSYESADNGEYINGILTGSVETITYEGFPYQGFGYVEAVDFGPYAPQSDGSPDTAINSTELTATNSNVRVFALYAVYNEGGDPNGSVLGRFEESDFDLRNRIKYVRDYGSSSTQSIANAIWRNVPELRTVRVLSNDTKSQVTINGAKVLPNSVLIVVSGSLNDVAVADDATRKSIAEAIYRTKAAGIGYTDPSITDDINGTVWGSTAGDIIINDSVSNSSTIRKNIIPITDISSGIEHNVVFYEAKGVGLSIHCTVKLNGYTGGNVTTAIRNIINQYVGGKMSELTPTELTMIISSSLSGVFVTGMEFFSGIVTGGDSSIPISSITPKAFEVLVPTVIDVDIEE